MLGQPGGQVAGLSPLVLVGDLGVHIPEGHCHPIPVVSLWLGYQCTLKEEHSPGLSLSAGRGQCSSSGELTGKPAVLGSSSGGLDPSVFVFDSLLRCLGPLGWVCSVCFWEPVQAGAVGSAQTGTWATTSNFRHLSLLLLPPLCCHFCPSLPGARLSSCFRFVSSLWFPCPHLGSSSLGGVS